MELDCSGRAFHQMYLVPWLVFNWLKLPQKLITESKLASLQPCYRVKQLGTSQVSPEDRPEPIRGRE